MPDLCAGDLPQLSKFTHYPAGIGQGEGLLRLAPDFSLSDQ